MQPAVAATGTADPSGLARREFPFDRAVFDESYKLLELYSVSDTPRHVCRVK